MPKLPWVIGVYGPAGSGKSCFCRILSEKLGWKLIVADELADFLLKEERCALKIKRYFGVSLMDFNHQEDKQLLSEIVFKSPASLHLLERILWPGMKKIIKDSIKQCNEPGIIIDAAVLFSAGWYRFCDFTLYIETKPMLRYQRLKLKGWDDYRINQLQNLQQSIINQKKSAHQIIRNNKSEKDLELMADELILRWIPSIARKGKAVR